MESYRRLRVILNAFSSLEASLNAASLVKNFSLNALFSSKSFSLNALQNRFFAVSGWRTEKLRNSRQRWLKVNHPPYQRSPIKRISDSCEKIMYVTNGTINKSMATKWLDEAKLKDCYIEKDGLVHTPCLVFCKEHYHTLLESLAMEEVIELENKSAEILDAFKNAETKLDEYNDHGIIHKPIKK